MIMETGTSTMIMAIKASRISMIIAGPEAESMMASNHGCNLYHYPDGNLMYSYHIVQ
jgi:hypothetical protein